jgi:hypothetical protein
MPINVSKNYRLESNQSKFASLLILLILKLEHPFNVSCLLIGALNFPLS